MTTYNHNNPRERKSSCYLTHTSNIQSTHTHMGNDGDPTPLAALPPPLRSYLPQQLPQPRKSNLSIAPNITPTNTMARFTPRCKHPYYHLSRLDVFSIPPYTINKRHLRGLKNYQIVKNTSLRPLSFYNTSFILPRPTRYK